MRAGLFRRNAKTYSAVTRYWYLRPKAAIPPPPNATILFPSLSVPRSPDYLPGASQTWLVDPRRHRRQAEAVCCCAAVDPRRFLQQASRRIAGCEGYGHRWVKEPEIEGNEPRSTGRRPASWPTGRSSRRRRMVSRRGFRLAQKPPWVRRHGERCAPARVRDHGTRYPHHARNSRRIIRLIHQNVLMTSQATFVVAQRLATDLDTKHGETDANKRDGARQVGRLNIAGLHL